MIKNYSYTENIEAVQYTGNNYKEISEFVSPYECIQRSEHIIDIFIPNKRLSMALIKSDYIANGIDGLRVIDKEEIDKYTEVKEPILYEYHKVGSISMGKTGVGIDFPWEILNRNYNGNTDLYIKVEEDK